MNEDLYKKWGINQNYSDRVAKLKTIITNSIHIYCMHSYIQLFDLETICNLIGYDLTNLWPYVSEVDKRLYNASVLLQILNINDEKYFINLSIILSNISFYDSFYDFLENDSDDLISEIKDHIIKHTPEIKLIWDTDNNEVYIIPNDNDFINNNVTQELVNNNNPFLEKYIEAIKSYSQNYPWRNVLDNFRLAVDEMSKSFENCNSTNIKKNFETILKQKYGDNLHTPIRQLILQIIEFYKKYSNDQIKHGDQIFEYEYSFFINLSSVILKLMIDLGELK